MANGDMMKQKKRLIVQLSMFVFSSVIFYEPLLGVCLVIPKERIVTFRAAKDLQLSMIRKNKDV